MWMRVPPPNKEYAIDFPMLTGGLNLKELDYRLPPTESPYMKNMWWQDGVLQCRDGQTAVSHDEAKGIGYTCYQKEFYGKAFFHIGTGIYYGQPNNEAMALDRIIEGVPENRGTFFQYYDWLFYKNRGGFYRISYEPDGKTFKGETVESLAYTPIIQINSNPEFGSGDLYQPENRLSAEKEIWYNAKKEVSKYQLPVKPIDSIERVEVDGKVLTPPEYTADLTEGTITFQTAPPVTDPPTPNTVKIKFKKANPDALKSIMDCRYAFVGGGDRNISILLAGSTKQPNAVFWNANDNLSMNAAYWPMTTFNLVGPTNDPVTGFGAQYKDIILFKAHSVGKLDFSLDMVDKRAVPLFTYTQINDRHGCDLPWTIQLVENNLVFCNTYQGVHVLQSSSPAYENNVLCISIKVNEPANTVIEDRKLDGLLADVRAGEVDQVTSWDDDTRYWVCANGNAYLWDYDISKWGDPSWFFFTSMTPVSFWSDEKHTTFHLGKNGDVNILERSFMDFDKPIEKVYQFPVLNFGDYSRLKDVTSVLFETRSDTPSRVDIQYETDYERREDQTYISTWTWDLRHMNLGTLILGYYNVLIPKYARVSKRRPKCRHIRHFTMTLSNNSPKEDLAIVSAQVFYNFQGKER